MMDKLKEFGLKLEMSKLEDIVCQYLFGDVHLHIDEMK